MTNLLGRRWTVPAASGVLIAISLLLGLTTQRGQLANAVMLAAAVVAGAPVALKAWRALSVKVIGIDLLVTVAAGGAVVIGEYWEAAAVTFLFAVGHALEAATLDRTRSALAELVAVAPDTAVVLRAGEQQEVPAGAVKIGETVLIKNGAKVPVDGEISGGTGALEESSITGESLPVDKTSGDKVFAGTFLTSGFLQVVATGVGADTTLARIIHRVEEAQDAKAPTQRFMDRFSAWYTPGVIVLAAAMGLVTRDVELALTLLVIGCPGALVISIPVSIVAGIGRAARDGLLVKGGEYLETAARIDAVALDKTGTLTRGRPKVARVVALASEYSQAEVLAWAARAEAASEHPLARPVLEAAADEGVSARGLPEVTEPIPGQGIRAVVDGNEVLVGNARLLERLPEGATRDGRQEASRLARAGETPMLVALNGRVIGVIGVADELREDAAEMVKGLHAAGIKRVVML
ncbi:MAG TPA: cation-translocating P-type ATPase, partial [Trueperaceae bacterium]|nr:cation-translocating P-type ATPase [Trueperaceae bacterium]